MSLSEILRHRMGCRHRADLGKIGTDAQEPGSDNPSSNLDRDIESPEWTNVSKPGISTPENPTGRIDWDDIAGLTISGHVTEYRRGGIAFGKVNRNAKITALPTALTIRRATPFRSID
jgi:hypothetical protein